MKRLLIAAVTLSMLSGSAAVAQPYRHDEGRHAGWDRGQDLRHHRWARGERLPPEFRTRGYFVDYRHHHLRPPPRGYRWVRVNDEYLLVALTTGVIASIINAG